MMPMAVIEALAAGKAVVATRVGGIPELISDGGSGLLVPPGDAEALSRALQVLLQNAGERARLGRAGQEHIRAHHSLQAVGERLAEAYRRALDLAGIGA
jgi:glycosyltransferase involved in cell wall biosynthesis